MLKNSSRVKKQPVYRYGIEIVRPWSQEMYAHNEKVLEEAKQNIHDVLAGTNCTQEICEVMTGYKFGHGYTIKDILIEAMHATDGLQFFQVSEIYSELEKQTDMPPLSKEIIGYETSAELNALRKEAEEMPSPKQEVIYLGRALLLIQETNSKVADIMGAKESYQLRVGTQSFERSLYDRIKELGHEHDWRSIVEPYHQIK